MMKRKPESKFRRNMDDINGRHVIAGRLLPLRNTHMRRPTSTIQAL